MLQVWETPVMWLASMWSAVFCNVPSLPHTLQILAFRFLGVMFSLNIILQAGEGDHLGVEEPLGPGVQGVQAGGALGEDRPHRQAVVAPRTSPRAQTRPPQLQVTVRLGPGLGQLLGQLG